MTNILCLIEHGANVWRKDCHDVTVVHVAALNGHTGAIRLLIEHGAEVDDLDSHIPTPLMLAAQNGHLETIHVLLKYGGSLNTPDDDGRLPLHAKGDHADVVKFLVKESGNVTAKNSNGDSVLHLTSCLELVTFLVEQGADINSRGLLGRTPLHVAAERGHLDTVKYLINKGADINSCNQIGFSILSSALEYGHAALVEALIERVCDLKLTNKPDPEGAVIMQSAATNGFTDVIKRLLAKGLSVDAIGRDGTTPLMVAARAGQYETVAFLLDRGANVNANALQRVEERSEWDSNCDDSGEEDGTIRVFSPFLWSLEAGHSEVAKLLIERGANTSDVRDKTTPLALEQLSGKGTLHYQKAKRGETLLISAVRRKNLDSVRWLLQQGEDVIEGDSLGDTALCCAITFIKHPEEVMEMCKLLLEFGADINVKNICSETPLLIATEFNVDNVAELLLELGCETKVKNKDSITPLLHSARHNNGKLTRICYSMVLGPVCLIRMISMG